jgi:hypothetical protein
MTLADLEHRDLFQIPRDGAVPADAPTWIVLKVANLTAIHVFGRLEEQIMAEGLFTVAHPEKLVVVKC